MYCREEKLKGKETSHITDLILTMEKKIRKEKECDASELEDKNQGKPKNKQKSSN